MRSTDELATEICTLAGHINAANTSVAPAGRRIRSAQGWSDSATQSCAHWLNWKCGIALGAAEKCAWPRSRSRSPHGGGSSAGKRGDTRVTDGHRRARHRRPRGKVGTRVSPLPGGRGIVARAVPAAEPKVSFRHDDDGSLILDCHLPAEAGAIVMKALDLAVEGLPIYQDVPSGTSPQVVPLSARRSMSAARRASSPRRA